MQRKKRKKRAPPVTETIVTPQQQIVPVAPVEILAPPSIEQVVTQAERQIKIRKSYIQLIAKELRPQDVLVFGGNQTEEIYLPAAICKNILSWAGVGIAFDGAMEEHHYNSPEGEFIEFVINATVTPKNGMSVPVIGNRSTRDEFFGIAGKERKCPVCGKDAIFDKAWETARWKSWHCKEHPREKVETNVKYLPLYDVDIASVRQAAVSNLWNHAVEAIGLRPNLIDLKDAGMDITKVKRIGFGRDEDEPRAGTEKAATVDKQLRKTAADSSGAGNAGRVAEATANSPGAHSTAVPNTAPNAGGPPRAEIPGDLQVLRGTVQIVYSRRPDNTPLVTSNAAKQPFRKVIVGGMIYFVFDNKVRRIDGKNELPTFAMLDELKSGDPIEFLWREEGEKKIPTVKIFTRIGKYEWETDGTPVLRREMFPPQREPGEDIVY